MDMSTEKSKGRVVLLEPPCPVHGAEAVVLREDGGVERGRIGPPIREGQDLRGVEVLHVSPLNHSPVVWDLKDRMVFGADGSVTKGPAKVTSHSYRSNYDQIFNPGELPN